MPRSPWRASTGLSTTLVEPVLVRVAEILWPTLPDLPMPTTMILPRSRSVATSNSTAWLNASSTWARTARRAASSISNTSLAKARCRARSLEASFRFRTGIRAFHLTTFPLFLSIRVE